MKLLRHLYAPVVSALLFALVAACSSGMHSVDSYEQQKQQELAAVKAGKFDNGRMWTFDDPPVQYFQETYGIRADESWLEQARLGALRFATWCSASFVSEDGLVMTNHHCSRTSIEKVQRDGERLLETGFYAVTPADERRVPELFVEQLVQIHDVTAEVRTAMDGAETDAAKVQARDAAIKSIEARYTDGTETRGQVISLYHGGKYSAYVFRKYNDVRLVLAPEIAIGHYGGEEDNFTYPRYALDFSFFRVYDEDGTPVKTSTFFKWSENGAKEGEPVFVLGNPGSTNRLATYAQLEYMRDVSYPYVANLIDGRLEVLEAYAAKSKENRDEVYTDILSMKNGEKAYAGRLRGLRDPQLMARRADWEQTFMSAVNAKPELKSTYGPLWKQIANDRAKARKLAPEIYGLRVGGLGTSAYLTSAYHAVRAAERAVETQEPMNTDPARIARMAQFLNANMEMEEHTLAIQLESMRSYLGANDPIVQFALQGQEPRQAAKGLLQQTAMKDSASYYNLAVSGISNLRSNNDRFVQLALMISPRATKASSEFGEIQNRDAVNQGMLGRAQYEVYGTAIPPDATFSLRIADGVVKGFEYNGTEAPVNTTFYGMYDRYYSFPGRESWQLPARWVNKPADFDLSTPADFVSTNDIIGGNSGSPIVNKNLEVVGLVFDGNIESLPGDFIFAEDAGNRTVSVHSSGIYEAVRAIYKAQRIATELRSGKMAR